MPIEIEYADARWKRVRGLAQHVAKAHALALSKRDQAKVSTILLSDDETIRVLNRQWRNKDKPTNVLSFPAADLKLPRGQAKPLGDLILSYDTCAREAEEAGKTLRNHALHLVVHGLLHLVGHDHENEMEAEKMEAREIRALAKLGIANPYVLNDEHV